MYLIVNNSNTIRIYFGDNRNDISRHYLYVDSVRRKLISVEKSMTLTLPQITLETMREF